MGILLAVLKILGIILLVILGLVLLVLMLVLFVPICYRIKAVHNESETTADAKISFLVVKVKAHFDKVNKLDYGAWILFFKVFLIKIKLLCTNLEKLVVEIMMTVVTLMRKPLLILC